MINNPLVERTHISGTCHGWSSKDLKVEKCGLYIQKHQVIIPYGRGSVMIWGSSPVNKV